MALLFVTVTAEEHSDGSIAFRDVIVRIKQNAFSTLDAPSLLRSRITVVYCLSTCYFLYILEIVKQDGGK